MGVEYGKGGVQCAGVEEEGDEVGGREALEVTTFLLVRES